MILSAVSQRLPRRIDVDIRHFALDERRRFVDELKTGFRIFPPKRAESRYEFRAFWLKVRNL